MNKLYTAGISKHLILSNVCRQWILFSASRTLLSDAYFCDETWSKRVNSPTLKDIRLDQYFVETDKKFGTKRLVSGVDLDIFANGIDDESHLDEIEHLLYRFRRTKRAPEIMDSTAYAVVRFFLKFKHYEPLFRILNDRENYGVFPDLYCYNLMMSTFLKEKMYKEAANVAILMMLQENFENKLSCLLGLRSCQSFLDNYDLPSLLQQQSAEANEGNDDNNDDDEETLVRVPFIRDPWFDDHFDLQNPQHLIGKTLYLIGRELHSPVGRSYQLYGLALYDKWEKAIDLLKKFSTSDDCPILNEAVTKVLQQIDAISDDSKISKESVKGKLDECFQEMKSKGVILDGPLSVDLEKVAPSLEKEDIEAQNKLFKEWEQQRALALQKQNLELDVEQRLKVVEQKKEYLFWKEKALFFFENEEEIREEVKKVNEMTWELKKKKEVKDSYFPPQIIKRKHVKKTIYQRLARVKKI